VKLRAPRAVLALFQGDTTLPEVAYWTYTERRPTGALTCGTA
jgi:hypothetical protein